MTFLTLGEGIFKPDVSHEVLNFRNNHLFYVCLVHTFWLDVVGIQKAHHVGDGLRRPYPFRDMTSNGAPT